MKAKKIPLGQSNPLIEDEIKTMKKELDIKYEKMNYLKEKIKKESANELKEDMKLRQQGHSNQIYSIEQEIKSLTK